MKMISQNRFAARLLTAGIFCCAAAICEAQIICNFENQTTVPDDTIPNAFPGRAGDGWRGAWEGRRYQPQNSSKKRYLKSLEGITIVDSEGQTSGRLVQIGKTNQPVDTGACISRAYEAFGDFDIDRPYCISFVIRVDSLPTSIHSGIMDSYLFIGESGTGAVGPNSGTTWAIQAFYGNAIGKSVAPGNAKHRLSAARQRQWNLVEMASDKDEPRYVATGAPLEEGVDYKIDVMINPKASTYQCRVNGGGTEYTSEVLRLRAGKTLGGNIVFGSRYSEESPAVFSVGDIKIFNSDS